MRSRVLLRSLLVWRSQTFSLQKKKRKGKKNAWSQFTLLPSWGNKTTWQRHLLDFITITFVYYLCAEKILYTHPVSPSQFLNPLSRLFQMSAEAPASPSLVPVHFFARSRTGNERVKIKNKMADERRASLSLFIIDAFTSKPFSGNPAAVCLVGSKVRFSLLS